jgi:hypothetical protein
MELGRKAPLNPRGLNDNCIACVAAYIKRLTDRTFKGTVEDLPEVASGADLPFARDYIKKQTGFDVGKPTDWDSAKPGHYVIVVGEVRGSSGQQWKHILYARVSEQGLKFIVDPQISRVYRGMHALSEARRYFGQAYRMLKLERQESSPQ